MGAFCLICLNHVWRTISIGVASALTCIVLASLTLINTNTVNTVMEEVLESKRCWKYNRAGQLNWTLIYNNTENSCIFVVLHHLFPWAVYGWTISHLLLDIMLCCGCLYRSNAVVLLYLTIDAGHLGFLSSIWSMSFLTERMPRMILMIFLFPLISFGLCAWMAVFGFYLRLEEAAWARLTLTLQSMFDLCSTSLQQGKLPQQKSLEEILKQELTWTMEQIGEEEEEEDVNKIHEIVAYTNDAFSAEDEI